MRKTFGTSAARSEDAKKKLDVRVQLPGETYTSYIEDVLALCRRVNASMTEDERVGHIFKGFPTLLFMPSPCKIQQVLMTSYRLASV